MQKGRVFLPFLFNIPFHCKFRLLLAANQGPITMKSITVLVSMAIFFANVVAQETPSPVKVGDPSPVFSLPDLQNNYVFLRDYSGKKLRKPWKNKTKYVVVMSFFATWCAPCKREISYLQKLKKEYAAHKIKFFLIDVGEEREVLDRFLGENDISLTVLHDRYQQTAGKFGATSLPRLIVIDKEGTISLIKKGFKDGDTFMKGMRTLLSELLSDPAKQASVKTKSKS